tara:strand:- start:189 stop:794 length:606 start_codon:yes stop_codon:yes gene_type:complete
LNKHLLSLFASNLIVDFVEEDTSELNVGDYEFHDNGKGDEGQGNGSKDLFILKRYPRVEQILIDKFKDYNKEVLKSSNEYRITTSWFTQIKKGDITAYHNHKNSFYSGVYYFDEYDHESGVISFLNPLKDLQDFTIRYEGDSIHNSIEWNIPPKKNLLLLFPSYLYHRVKNNISNNNRYSLAFNIVPIGEYGVGDSTYTIF